MTVGPEDVLLALLDLPEENPVRRLLATHGCGPSGLDQPAPPDQPRVASPPMSAAVSRAIESSLREARAAGSETVSEGHLLLGIMATADGAAATWLGDHGLTVEEGRTAALAAGPIPPDPGPEPRIRVRPSATVEELFAPPIDEDLDPHPPD
jgi:ATP-dependent Clp protease ATP-binding subunit ClpA